MDILSVLLNQTNIFLLIFARISGIFTAAPFFSSNNIPRYAKAGMSLLLSYILLPLISTGKITLPDTFWTYIALVVGEFILGLLFGFVSYLIFYAVQMAGHLIDLQIGFGIVNIFDPQFGQQIPLLGNFLYILGMLVFLITNGHHILLTALFASFKVIPLTGVVFHPSLAEFITNLVIDVFIIGFKISLPVLVTLLLTDVALGILARTMPQMNIFVVGVPGKIAIGIFILAVALPFYIAFLEVGFNGMYQNIYHLLAQFG
ncbi:MAG: flagellar biosynthetic protein FliR [Negativicutes bacterium]|nr:flagellar biosynthetic protein FliR [Negativicutes bacterium]